MNDYIEEGRRRAIQLRSLATTIAALIGYAVDPPADDAYHGDRYGCAAPAARR